MGPRVSRGSWRRTMSTYSRSPGSIAWAAWPETWAPSAPETARAAASGGGDTLGGEEPPEVLAEGGG
eukprot:10364234-Alexandrium_andersonii.AAC.1